MSTVTMNSFGGHIFSQCHHGGYFSGLPEHDSNFQDIFRRRQHDISLLINATSAPLQSISNPSFPVSADTIPVSSSSASASSSPTNPPFISPLATHSSRHDSLASLQSAGSKRKAAPLSTDEDTLNPTTAVGDDHDDEVQTAAIKRQRNTMAARKYRQKRLDKIADLERALEEMTSERDDLKIKLARREAEVDALREMLGKK